jgi:hypothetical protein
VAAPKATTTKKKTTTTATGKERKTTAPRGTKSSGARQAPRVVVFPDRDKYHRPGCRFAGGRGFGEGHEGDRAPARARAVWGLQAVVRFVPARWFLSS